MLPMVRTPLPHRPTISRGRKPRRKACPVKHSRPKARAHSKDAPVTMHRASPPRNSDMTTAFMDMIPFHARPGLSNAFPPEKPCIAGRLPPVCTTWTISGKSRLPALPYDEKPGPSCKEAGLIFFFPLRALSRSAETWVRPLRCPELRPSRRQHTGRQDTVSPPPAPCCRRIQPRKSSPPTTRERGMPTAPCRRTLSGLPPPG